MVSTPLATLLHLSDLHHGPHFIERVADALVQASARLKPDVVVVSGDFTNRARPVEFGAAREFLSRLPDVPRLLVPGNHDVPLYRLWERAFRPHQLYREFLGDVDSVVPLSGAVLVGLDSTDPLRAIKNGRLRRRQLEFCEEAFSGSAPTAWRIVALHHHLVPAPSFERTPPMARAERTLEALTRLDVDLVLAGHLHRAYVGNSLDVYAGERRERGIIIVQCGTSTSRRGRGREREKNTFNLVRLYSEHVSVDHYMYFDDGDGFFPTSMHEFARPARGPLLHRARDENP